jgi:hypothetical protein
MYSKSGLLTPSRHENKIDQYVYFIKHMSSVFKKISRPWRAGLVVTSPPDAEETGAMGREIESRRGIGW